MSPRLPPRREPRVLAVARTPAGLHYATADPWELRSSGSLSCREVSIAPALLRIARREKPTLLTVADANLLRAAARVALHLRIALVTQDIPRLPLAIAQDLYPELPMRAPTPPLARLAALAISTVLYCEPPCPSRRYAPKPHPRQSPHARRYGAHERAA